jgi:nitrous oxidase accessory protein
MSKSLALLLVLALLTAPCIITFLPVQAESRTIVVPDDYSTIQEAVNAVREGDTIFVKKGTYEEKTLNIDKSISITAEDAEFTKLNLFPPLYSEFDEVINFTFSWYGSAIIVNANDFKLSGFTINTPEITNIPGGTISITGNKTKILSNKIIPILSVNGSYSNIEDNTLSDGVSLYGSYCKISANNIDGSGGIDSKGFYNNISANNVVGKDNWGIRVEGAFCLVHSNMVTESSGMYGIYIYSNGTIVGENSVDSSKIGIAIIGSNNVVYGNLITNCGVQPSIFAPNIEPRSGAGIQASGSNIIYANYIARNVIGARINPYPETNLTSILYHNNFIDNTFQISTQDMSYGFDSFDNGKEGNYWSDYTGEDADGNEIGDTPYMIDDIRSDRYPLMVPFEIDSLQVDLSDWMAPPSVQVISPKNATYVPIDLTLEFTVSKQTSWLGYSLDGEANVTITGNTTLPKLSYGSHKIQVYATDLVGHNSTSETTYFSVVEPFPTTLVIASVITVTVVGIGLLVFFKKRKH